MSYDGLFLAILEEGSKKIRIYNSNTGKLSYELTILAGNKSPKKFISISRKNDLLFYSQNKGEIDIFSLKRAKMDAKKENTPEDEYNLDLNKDVFNKHTKNFFTKREEPFIRILIKSDFEYEFIKIDDEQNSLFIVSSNGKLFKYKLDLKKKEYSLDGINSFII